ncbi:TRP-domain-containing protein [Trichodelitschia bisporula]|uniref:TRP-domain-containing protein n=1 Tax=Trichodelitschia bisporula TaxID=703511 RepID=A0A6G1HLX0_9PEZI|nr:TRP-domain-containing protein [Trichodelitschia bisporula]
MRLSRAAVLAAGFQYARAVRMIESTSLNPCMANSSFTATFFNVVFTPDNATLAYNINGESEVSAYVTLDIQVSGYGYDVYHKTLDPCSDPSLKGVCPMSAGSLQNLRSNAPLPADAIKQVPNAIYYIPDLDGKVRVWINETDDRRPLACVEAELRNGKTVNQKGVAWAIAVLTGLCLVSSAIASGRGHFSTSAHVAANILSILNYFQAQAQIGMTAVHTPPIIRAWTQNFQWSMGIIRVGFLQRMATWYQRATGGKPAMLLSSLSTMSVHIQKRSNLGSSSSFDARVKTVKGIERVSFMAGIEATNTFFTGYTMFTVVLLLVSLLVVLFRYACEGLVRSGKMHSSKFYDFRHGWLLVLKGIIFRLVLIGFAPMVVLCIWEFTRHDSGGEVALAVSVLLFVVTVLAFAAVKIWLIAARSEHMHKSPAYILYADPMVLNKWGFLYVSYKADVAYFLIPMLVYTFVKAVFVGAAQKSGIVQAIAFVILDMAMLIAMSIMKPFMDRATNAWSISIASINALNSLILLLLSGIFGLPPLAIGVLGVLFFVVNCVFTVVLLATAIWTAGRAIVSKNPDNHYQAVLDDRVSFKSTTNLELSELSALAATARGESRLGMRSNNSLASGFRPPEGPDGRKRLSPVYGVDWAPPSPARPGATFARTG